MPVYYPMVASRLVVRFDEALLADTVKLPVPTTPEGNADNGTGLPGGPSAQASALVGTGSRLTHSLVIVPKSASIELPSVRQAQKFSMTYAFRDFPVDPRAIRAMSVEIYIGVVDGSNFGRGMLGQMDGGRLASQLALNTDNLMLVGIVDNLTTTFSDKSSEVRLDGRGLQGMLLDAKVHADQLEKLDLTKNIKAVVEQLLGMDAQGKGIPVRIADGAPDAAGRKTANEWPNGVPSPTDPSLVTRIMKGQDGNKSNLPMKSDPNSVAVWDVVTNLCAIVGAVPYFIANNLWIRPAKSIFTQANAGTSGNAPTPFARGEKRNIKLAKGSVDVAYRKMVYGKNLLNFKMERKFGGAKVPVVKVVSLGDGKGPNKLISAEWPPEDQQEARTSAVDPSGEKARSEPLVIYKPGIKDKARLLLIAEQVHNEVGRGELGGSSSTKDLASLGGDNSDADIIRLRPGDAVEFLTDIGGVQSIPPVVSELNQQASEPALASKSIQGRLGFSKDLADLLVGTSRGTFANLQNTFRIANVKYGWDISSGITVDFDFQNYIEARYDVVDKSVEALNKIVDAAAPKIAKLTTSYGSASKKAGT